LQHTLQAGHPLKALAQERAGEVPVNTTSALEAVTRGKSLAVAVLSAEYELHEDRDDVQSYQWHCEHEHGISAWHKRQPAASYDECQAMQMRRANTDTAGMAHLACMPLRTRNQLFDFSMHLGLALRHRQHPSARTPSHLRNQPDVLSTSAYSNKAARVSVTTARPPSLSGCLTFLQEALIVEDREGVHEEQRRLRSGLSSPRKT
jgi:hypothetical protein